MASRKRRGNGSLWGDIVSSNTFSALKDESYVYIVKRVEDFLKDPEVREEIEDAAYRIIAAIYKGAKKYRAKKRKNHKNGSNKH